ncbi:hypothetical protein B0H13DRAFT_1951073 [Mycena leptocephala]|nr:hypothetical protein B0H13DRAFT_1971508 [Mycena leptocephala]KAJ7934524.1 hypothetical protein B0H13DRAFT_1951073 [Mycena leptocephala]
MLLGWSHASRSQAANPSSASKLFRLHSRPPRLLYLQFSLVGRLAILSLLARCAQRLVASCRQHDKRRLYLVCVTCWPLGGIMSVDEVRIYGQSLDVQFSTRSPDIGAFAPVHTTVVHPAEEGKRGVAVRKDIKHQIAIRRAAQCGHSGECLFSNAPSHQIPQF